MHLKTAGTFIAVGLCFTHTVANAQLECVDPPPEIPAYSLEGDSASFLVTSIGNVLARPEESIDENDRIVVWVLTTSDDAPLIRVRRSSAFRLPGIINIAGANPSSRADTIQRSGKLCAIRLSLGDFAPGKGEVTIERVEPEGTDLKVTTLGQFDFGVNTLYMGAVSLGPIRSTLIDPTYAIVENGATSVVTQTAVGESRILYVLMYTPFIWGGRDTDKPAKRLWHRLNPAIGFTLTDITKNAMAGATVDLPFGVFLSAGWHFAKVSELDPRSGAELNRALAGSIVPTRTQWKKGSFAGVTLDLRVALKLIKAATTTTLQ